MKRFILTLSLLPFLSAICLGQRLYLSDISAVVQLSNKSNSISEITKYLKMQAPNWVAPKEVPDKEVLIVKWDYNFQGKTSGDLTLLFYQKGPIHVKLRYRFSYKAQYTSLIDDLPTDAELVNQFSNNGANYKLYETDDVTFAFITYPANLNIFFKDGKPTESYSFELHNKVN